MDKKPLPYALQKQFYDKCLQSFFDVSNGEEQHVFLFTGFQTVHLCFPHHPAFTALLSGCRAGFPESADIKIYLAVCDEDSFPSAPVDRYSFSRRGDIAGFDGRFFQAVYLKNESAIIVVDTVNEQAVILFRKFSGEYSIRVSEVFRQALTMLLRPHGMYFLPATINPENVITIHLDYSPHLLTADFLRSQGDVVHKHSWLLCSKTELLHACPFPVPAEAQKEKSTFSEVKNVCFVYDYSLKPVTGLSDRSLFNALLFSGFAANPYSGTFDIEFVEYLKSRFLVESDQQSVTSDSPFVSFVIPAYNAEAYLMEAVSSIFELNYPNFELIIADDGSEDKTAQLVASLPAVCRYIYQPNAGTSVARNCGILSAAGAFLLILDADDLINPSAFYSLLNTLVENPEADVVCGYAQKFTVTDKTKKIFLEGPADAFPYYVGACLFRKRAFQKAGLFDPELRMSEDTEWFVRAEQQNLSILRIPEISLFVRRHEASLTSQAGINELQLFDLLLKRLRNR